MGGVGINSTPDLEKTQAELRQTFSTAEKFRRELDFLQKGGDPLDLKPGNATSVSFQSTSLKEQFLTSEAKGSFAVTASPHGDSVESSGRLGGAPSVCEPNSADNLMLLKESGDSAVLELPKKSYKRRIRSHRPSRDPIRHASRDYNLKNNTSHLENELAVLPIKTESLGIVDQIRLADSKGPTNGNTEVIKSIPGPTNVLDSNGNGLHTEQNLGSNDLDAEKNDTIVKIDVIGNEDGPAVKEEEGLKGSESVKEVGSGGCIVVGPSSNFQDGNANHMPSTCSQDNLKSATKEDEDSVLEEARIIEAKRKRIAELSVRTSPQQKRLKSHWDFVLEEMSWLANDFAQERLWKVTAAAQISRRVAYSSRVRFQQQSSLQKQKELSHTLAEAVMQFWHMMQVKCKEPESHKDHAVGIQGYAIRFMDYNNSSQAQCNATQAPMTVDIISDLGIIDHSWEDNLTEENLFYTVPPGAIEAYRKAIDSHFLHFEKTGTHLQEEVDTSCNDVVADNDAFEEDEGETNTYYTKAVQKRRNNFSLYGPRSYATGDDVSFMERSVGNQPSVLSGKRSGSSLNVTIPTKRVRTASRQRIISPYNAGTSIHAPNRTDASSADTNSFQDEHSNLPNNLEAESAGDYEKQLQFDSMEVSNRPRKKKKEKHHGSTFEHRWQHDSSFQYDQKDLSRRRLDTHQFDSNGNSAVSQMSNMSNPHKFMKLLVRDRGRKVKALKASVGSPGSGCPWSLFEDQALVVLVHDLGPNWELISDAINSTLQFKCIFRNSKECKERHKILMDMNTGDGADSAEDSGSSQPYPSTLPGIPEGSARQLFQRLQGPMEEDTLKSHFEKIIKLGQKQHYRNRTQKDNQDPKQLQPPHSSHAFSLSQVCPNNLNGGPVLTPVELCEAISSSPDVGLHSGVNHSPVLPSGRYGIPRTVDEQQRMQQQYGQMLSARNTQQSVNDRGVRMGGVNRNMKLTRPGPQGLTSSGSSTPTSSSMHSNSMLRPMQANQNSNHPRAISPHHFQGPPNHHVNPAYAIRLAKERQQRLLQQHQFMPHVQPPQESQSSGNQLVKQQRPHPHPHQQAKLIKGGRGISADSSLVNGFSVPGSSAGKQHKTFSGQTQVASLKKPFDSSNHKATAQKLLLLNRKANQTTSKQAESPVSQPSTAVTTPNAPCNDANSSETETPVVSSSTPGESEPSGPPVNQVTVHKQTLSDNLSSLVEHDVGVQQQPTS